MGVDYEPLAAHDQAEIAAAGRPAVPAEFTMAIAAVLMTCANVSVKSLRVPLIELVQGRYLAQWALTCSALALRSYLSDVPFRPFGPPGQRRWLLLRAAIYFAFIFLWWSTLRLVPVGNASVTIKVEVFMIGLLSRSLFGEKLSRRWWISGVVSLVGVALVVRPPFLFGGAANDGVGSASVGVCLNLLAAVFGALTAALVKLAPDAHFLEVQHCTDFVCGVVLCPPLLLAFGTPSLLVNWTVLESAFLVATFGISAMCLMILSYQLGNPGRIAAIGYLEVPCSYAAQIFLFGTTVEWSAILGSLLIVAAAFSVAREKAKAQADTP